MDRRYRDSLLEDKIHKLNLLPLTKASFSNGKRHLLLILSKTKYGIVINLQKSLGKDLLERYFWHMP